MHSTLPETPESTNLALLIRRLSEIDGVARGTAAAEIFRRGCELVRVVTSKWLLDSQLSNCFVPGDRGAPKTVVGLAVNRGSFDRIRIANGSPRLASVPDDQDAEEFELDFPAGISLDILTTKQPGAGGAIDRFLQKSGEGIQQVELLVRDVELAAEILRERFGIAPIYPHTREGADGTRVNFFLVAVEGGKKALIELVESR